MTILCLVLFLEPCLLHLLSSSVMYLGPSYRGHSPESWNGTNLGLQVRIRFSTINSRGIKLRQQKFWWLHAATIWEHGKWYCLGLPQVHKKSSMTTTYRLDSQTSPSDIVPPLCINSYEPISWSKHVASCVCALSVALFIRFVAFRDQLCTTLYNANVALCQSVKNSLSL
jgi:hypothetical protein